MARQDALQALLKTKQDKYIIIKHKRLPEASRRLRMNFAFLRHKKEAAVMKVKIIYSFLEKFMVAASLQ